MRLVKMYADVKGRTNADNELADYFLTYYIFGFPVKCLAIYDLSSKGAIAIFGEAQYWKHIKVRQYY